MLWQQPGNDALEGLVLWVGTCRSRRTSSVDSPMRAAAVKAVLTRRFDQPRDGAARDFGHKRPVSAPGVAVPDYRPLSRQQLRPHVRRSHSR